jgi:hypothetical protein
LSLESGGIVFKLSGSPVPRRKIQRAFLSWLEKNRLRFAIEIKLGRRTDCVLEFSFVGVNSAIEGLLNTREIEVFAMYEDECWDILVEFNAEPKRVSGGYVCEACPPGSPPLFPDRSSLWADHLFEPFLEWVNNDLANAKWLSLRGNPGYATSARLLADESRELRSGGAMLDFGVWVMGRQPAEKPEERRILLPCRTS